MLATTHAGLPPLFLQVGGIDPLRDDGLVYEQVLREAGVKTKFEVYVLTVASITVSKLTTFDRYTGMPHGGGKAMFPGVTIYEKWDRDQVEGLKWLLSL